MKQPTTGNEQRAASTEDAVERTTPPAELPATLGHEGVAPAGALGLPEQFGRYRVRKLLGRGGMGAVYLAEDNMLERQVALKVPHHGTAGSPAALQRFYREARSAARLRQPHICPVYDVGEVDGVPYLTMAFIEGEALSSQVADYAARPPQDAARLARLLALALDEAHRQGVVHRDLKPSNVMIDRRGEPVIMDFGLAREVRTGSPSDTNPGTVLGTPAYMAPEQARGDVTAVGPGCDIYSLGALLYELLTGRVPFVGNALEVLVQQVRDQPPAPSSLRADLDGHVETICLKALAKEPSERFLSMGEFAQALADYLEGNAVCQPEQCCGLPPPLIAEGLVLLRTWGWETGHEKIRERLATRPECSDNPTAKLLVDWLSGEAEAAKEAVEGLRAARQFKVLHGWALAGRAFRKNREHLFAEADRLLKEADQLGDLADPVLRATLAHQRGFFLYQSGKLDRALAVLHEALGLLGKEHFYTARVLDTLGLVYAGKSNFHVAHELLTQALLCRDRFGHEPGVAMTHGQLGNLCLEWGELDDAEEHFQKALRLYQRLGNERGQTRMFQYLGHVYLRRGEDEQAAGRKAAARRHWSESAQWLDECLRACREAGQPLDEGYALRERALLSLAEGDLDAAEEHAGQAEAVFESLRFEEGLAKARRVRGAVLRQREQFAEAQKLLRLALAHFDRTADRPEAARTQLELARLQADSRGVKQLVRQAYLEALRRAEECRRTDLVRAVEEEFQAVDEEAHWQHVFHRARGRGATADTTSLCEVETEVATALFLNLEEFIPFCQGLDPEWVLWTVNQLMADLTAVLERHKAHVTAYLGGGFMALSRGQNHAERAVKAALELFGVVDEFNRPRAVLGLRQLPARIGIASGTMCLGNVGTYQRMDFTAVGAAVNLAARLMRQGVGSYPVISAETYDIVKDRFEFAPGSPRALDLRGIGRREVWDVIGRKKGTDSSGGA